MINLYVAAAGSERDFAARVGAALANRHSKLRVVSGWGKRYDEAAKRLGPGANQTMTDEERDRIFKANLEDMRAANVFVVITSRGGPRDTYAELGFAVAHLRPVVLVEGYHRSTFGHAHNVVRITDDVPNTNAGEIDLIDRIMKAIDRF